MIASITTEHDRSKVLNWVKANCPSVDEKNTSKAMLLAVQHEHTDVLDWIKTNRKELLEEGSRDLSDIAEEAAKSVRLKVLEWMWNNDIDMYVDELNYFINCIKHNNETMNSVQKNLETLSLALTMKK